MALGPGGSRSREVPLVYAAERPVLAATIYFGLDKSALTSRNKKTLIALAKTLRDQQFQRLRVDGHTDSVSSQEYNEKLSLRRAKTALGFLERRLLRMDVIVRGLGELMPIASNGTTEGRALNRRVEFYVW